MGKIDTTKDFDKTVSSLREAIIVLNRALLVQGLGTINNYTTHKYGRRLDSAYGSTPDYKWEYCARSKRVSLVYTDGREKPQEKAHPEYYVVWIEGLEPKTGEKIHKILPEHTYTTSMAKAMRVLPEHRETVLSILRERGVSEWALRNCFSRTNYAPKGTLFVP